MMMMMHFAQELGSTAGTYRWDRHCRDGVSTKTRSEKRVDYFRRKEKNCNTTGSIIFYYVPTSPLIWLKTLPFLA